MKFHKKHKERDEWIACKVLAEGSNWSPSDLVRLGLEVLECGCKTWKTCRTLLRLGQDECRKRNRTVSFARAAEDAIACREHLRPATLETLRQLLRRIMRLSDIGEKPVRSITPNYCERVLEKCFSTPRQKLKGRSALSIVLAHACKRGWCDANAVEKVDVPFVKEHTIKALSVPECETLLKVAKELFGGEGLPAVAIMMFAGIRPTEMSRLEWSDIFPAEKTISIPPAHSKTGGRRHVSILPPLANVLEKCNSRKRSGKITPANWRLKWRKIHKEFSARTKTAWQTDVLRHTFASYFAARFRNFSRLQIEMGHSSARLLRTRYLNMAGINPQNAQDFWNIRLKNVGRNVGDDASRVVCGNARKFLHKRFQTRRKMRRPHGNFAVKRRLRRHRRR